MKIDAARRHDFTAGFEQPVADTLQPVGENPVTF